VRVIKITGNGEKGMLTHLLSCKWHYNDWPHVIFFKKGVTFPWCQDTYTMGTVAIRRHFDVFNFVQGLVIVPELVEGICIEVRQSGFPQNTQKTRKKYFGVFISRRTRRSTRKKYFGVFISRRTRRKRGRNILVYLYPAELAEVPRN